MISLAASLSTSKKGYGREDGYTIHALLLVQCFCVLHQVLRTSIRITAARHTIRSRGQGHSAGDAEHEKAEDGRKQTQISINPGAKVIVRAMQSMRKQKQAVDTAHPLP